MKSAIFKDLQLQKQFDEDGFVKISMLTNDEIIDLKEIQNEYIPQETKGFLSSSYFDDFEIKKTISQKITAVLEKKIHNYFQNVRLIGAAYLIKGKGEHSEMPMHQDWTIVDEEKYYAVNIWIPLTETNEHNGTLELMKGSHKWDEALRAPTLPMSFVGFEDQIKSHLTMVNAKPGEVVILNQATVHYSKPNNSEMIRPAITAGMISQEADLKFFYWDSEKEQIEEFHQEDDFLLKFENFHDAIYKRPQMGKSLGFHDYSIPKLDQAKLNRLLNISEPSGKKGSFFKRLFG